MSRTFDPPESPTAFESESFAFSKAPPQESPPAYESTKVAPSKPVSVDPKLVCLFCLKNNTDGSNDFCSETCTLAADAKGPSLLAVPPDHHTFAKASKHFRDGWSQSSYQLHHVYRIIPGAEVTKAFESYRAELDNRSLYPGSNIQFQWLWTGRCKSWKQVEANMSLCTQSCKFCGPIRTPFADELVNLITQADASSSFKGYYVDTLCEVAMGRVFDKGGKTPPPFYDSTSTRSWFLFWRNIKVPPRAVLPKYVVFFK
jgi:hypothetical protein